ncbi:hypothetical protein H4R34_002800 [Dimargaris verticillata]|uniref:Vacuolar ATPase assembly protein VMA22 n=1 Tax=Dimargaris verticillata TaxID=2761393 RepID=A0A9W8B169_9FUNG|nr:hypothetical protein H4R34_002800 [Dimargaris verticillata]
MLTTCQVDPATYWLNDELTASAEKSLEDSARLASQTLRQRRPQTATEQPDSLPTSPTPNPETTDPKPIPMAVDPLRWFGLLTPASLQRGQQLFVRALDCGIRVANLRRQLDAAYTLISQSSEGDATLPEASKP